MTSNLTQEAVEEEQDQLVGDDTYMSLKQIGYEFKKPTQSVASRFIRRTFSLNIEISADRDVIDSYYYAISQLGAGYVNSLFDVSNNYGSYEKAFEAGIIKAVDHIKMKKLSGNHSR
jgi:hypothetical protein